MTLVKQIRANLVIPRGWSSELPSFYLGTDPVHLNHDVTLSVRDILNIETVTFNLEQGIVMVRLKSDPRSISAEIPEGMDVGSEEAYYNWIFNEIQKKSQEEENINDLICFIKECNNSLLKSENIPTLCHKHVPEEEVC